MKMNKQSTRRGNVTLAAVLAAVAVNLPAPSAAAPQSSASGQYATVNGLKLYYEVHGTGKPLLLLHGAFGTVEGWGEILRSLAKVRRVIVVEVQGHGHTADIDRPLTYAAMADDAAALLRHLQVDGADVYGYSMGANVAMHLAVQHPTLARKVIVHAGNFNKQGWEPESYKQFSSLPADFAPEMLKAPYDKVAPDPKKWPALVAKIKKMGMDFKGLSPAQLRSIKAKALIVTGDRDAFRPEHAVEMYRLIPGSELAVLPGTDHFAPWTRPDQVIALVKTFIDPPAAPKAH